MGSIIDYVSCKQCGGDAYNDYYYNTGEEYQFCTKCGAGFSWKILRDDDRKPILKDGKLQGVHNEHGPTGVVYLSYKDRPASTYQIPDEDFDSVKWKEDVLKEFKENKDLDLDNCYATLWNKEKQELELVFGKMPENVFGGWNEEDDKEGGDFSSTDVVSTGDSGTDGKVPF